MKKTLIATNVLLLGIVFFMACNSGSKKASDKSLDSTNLNKADNQDIAMGTEARLRLPGVFYARRENLEKGIISDSIAKAMSENYRDDVNKSKIFGMDPNVKTSQDTRAIWFSVETLKAFIAKIESSTRNDKFNLALGVRIYYAKYPTNADMKKCESLKDLKDEGVAKRHTVFMVPTFFDTVNLNHVDFNFNMVENPSYPTPYSVLMARDSYKKRPVPAILGFDKSKYIYNGHSNTIRKAMEDEGAAQNHGGMAPPPAGEATFPSSNQ